MRLSGNKHMQRHFRLWACWSAFNPASNDNDKRPTVAQQEAEQRAIAAWYPVQTLWSAAYPKAFEALKRGGIIYLDELDGPST